MDAVYAVQAGCRCLRRGADGGPAGPTVLDLGGALGIPGVDLHSFTHIQVLLGRDSFFWRKFFCRHSTAAKPPTSAAMTSCVVKPAPMCAARAAAAAPMANISK